ncbi:MAG TPA: PQQ-dependent sugar dehydrogenase [Solirubrobacterales bacterium]|nr:PQQ-dependent sugar dehydrogenase [Solirubrobacterales bacterium]
MRRTAHLVPLLACVAAFAWAACAQAATLVPVGDFDNPIFVTSDPANPDRLLVAEREGRVVEVSGSSSTVFADIQAWVRCCEGERGLLSIAPALDFATSGRLYAAYTGETVAGGAVGDIHVDAFRPNPGGGAPLREPLTTIAHSSQIHNGGQLQLARDGHLYLSTGDNGEGAKAQDPGSLLGKILRIDPADGSTAVWASGLRNPWRFSLDRLSGTMVIGDVGQDLREEVDIGVAGANYGWNCREGFVAYPGAPASCAGRTGFTDPVFDYPHANPGDGGAFGCSITGGYVVRDPGVPELYGRYLYADFCVGQLRSLVLPPSPTGLASGDRSEGLSVANPVSFGEDSAGRLYVASKDGPVYRLVGSPGATVAPPPLSLSVKRRPLVILQARKVGRRTVKLIVRVLPCGENAGNRVYVNRNGRLFRQRRLSRRCVAKFRVRVRGRTRFRAFFEGQRSQVRKIALAKPRP